MAQLPVIFLAFANNQDNPLDSLLEEDQALYSLFVDGASQQQFFLHRESYSSIGSISNYLTEFSKRLLIFHYGGHAESDKLILTDQEADAGGIARMLAGEEDLKLVFLNGCSTKAQVVKLLELGIPAVIATQAPINDRIATAFSKTFYQNLLKKKNLQDAFERAAGAAQAMGKSGIEIVRSASFQDSDDGNDDMPWGLYIKEEDMLQWTLEFHSLASVLFQPSAQIEAIRQSPVNKTLTETLFTTLSSFSEELEFLNFKLSKGQKIDERLVRRAIIDSLPAPVGEQIRKLFAAEPGKQTTLDRLSKPRLLQLLKTYNTLIELLTFSLLAQLWDAVFSKGNLDFPKKYQDILEAYLSMDPKELPFYDYIKLIRAIRSFFDENQIPYFIEELGDLKDIFAGDADFQAAHAFMEALKTELINQERSFNSDQINELCLQAEFHLSEIFKRLGFCARYKFATIKGIDIINPKHKPASFRHYKVKLDTVTAGYLDLAAVYSTFTDDKSVIFMKSLDDVEQYVSLSPFVIDENALKNEQKSKLYFFSHYLKDQDVYRYKFVNDDSDILDISSQNYPEIKEQFELFKEQLLQ